ncbi:unnamed protein product [Caenorhabditis angaria]|uniref:Uncharacterized protein n=1 Tax=Caenorhabditis angaria TaxID=860376 RepID=A0A9P1N1L4_9PELO|nr:unnamed protein product [Caenorhabditis angaria]
MRSFQKIIQFKIFFFFLLKPSNAQYILDFMQISESWTLLNCFICALFFLSTLILFGFNILRIKNKRSAKLVLTDVDQFDYFVMDMNHILNKNGNIVSVKVKSGSIGKPNIANAKNNNNLFMAF